MGLCYSLPSTGASRLPPDGLLAPGLCALARLMVTGKQLTSYVQALVYFFSIPPLSWHFQD